MSPTYEYPGSPSRDEFTMLTPLTGPASINAASSWKPMSRETIKRDNSPTLSLSAALASQLDDVMMFSNNYVPGAVDR